MIWATNTTYESIPQVLGSVGSTIAVSVMLLFQHHIQEFSIYLGSINTINNIRFLFCFCNIFGILLPLLRMPGLLACKPIPFKGVFCFLSHSNFLLQDLFSLPQSFFLLQQPFTTYTCKLKERTQRFCWTPLSSSFLWCSIFLLIPNLLPPKIGFILLS